MFVTDCSDNRPKANDLQLEDHLLYAHCRYTGMDPYRAGAYHAKYTRMNLTVSQNSSELV